MKEKPDSTWTAIVCSLIVHLATVPWIIAVLDKLCPKGWWDKPMYCSLIAAFIATFISLAAFIAMKLDDLRK